MIKRSVKALPCRMRKVKSPRQIYLAKRRNDKLTVILLQIGVLAALIGLWELAAQLGWIDPFITSCPSRIVKTLGGIDAADLFRHIGYTLLECIVGFIVASAIGILIAVLLWRFNKFRRVAEPYIVVLNALPKIALGPIIIIMVGAGSQAIIMMTVLICVIVTIISVLNGFMSVDDGKIFLMRSMGASRFQILTKLIFPANVPALVNMLKINVGLAWVGTIHGRIPRIDGGARLPDHIRQSGIQDGSRNGEHRHTVPARNSYVSRRSRGRTLYQTPFPHRLKPVSIDKQRDASCAAFYRALDFALDFFHLFLNVALYARFEQVPAVCGEIQKPYPAYYRVYPADHS